MREKNTSGERVRQIWKKIGVFFTWFLLKVFALLVHFLPFWFIFCTFVCANFSDSKFCQCYFVSFSHLWGQVTHQPTAPPLSPAKDCKYVSLVPLAR